MPNLRSLLQNSFSKLESLGYDLVFVDMYDNGKDINLTAFEYIKNGQLDFGIFHLPDLLPIHPSEDLVIAALSERQNAQDCLVIHQDVYDLSADLRLKSGTDVYVSSQIQAEQLKNLSSSIRPVVSDENVGSIIDLINAGEVKAAIIPKFLCDITTFATSVKIVNLHPKEMIPTPGQGAFGFVTLTENLIMRRLLKAIHEKQTAEMTNVERKVLLMSPSIAHPDIATYCYKDISGNFHTIASHYDSEASSLRFASHSQSTSEGLADALFNSLYHK